MQRKHHISISCILCIFLGIVFVGSTGITLAKWSVSSESVQNINIASVNGQIVEEYEQGQTVDPQTTVDKVVQVKNIGTIDAITRIKIEKAWGDSRTPDGELITNSELKTDNIIIHFDTGKWYYDTDGYFYYKDVLKPGEITSPLFKSFTLQGENSQDYQGKFADIVIFMEMIQAEGNGISYWNQSFENLGITYTPDHHNPEQTSVQFINSQIGFQFPEKVDLFVNFKNLAPGEFRNQTITIENQWNKNVNIFLRADFIDQDQATPETISLINKLLKEYANIVITEENGNVLYSGPIWGNPDQDQHNPDSMRYNYNLGNFSAGEAKKINVNLSVSPETDNQYKSLLGKIKWIFSAEGAESEIPISPDTSDTNIFLYFFIMLFSGIAFSLTFGILEKRKSEIRENKKH